ncbi:MAG: hypothetical protein IKQ62_00345 [Bacteroidaceae bacterium]|nr:hypothetical protein [Bacteroidaceae bacterium]
MEKHLTFLLVLLSLLATSCRSHRELEREVRTDTVFIHQTNDVHHVTLRTDTLREKDSIYIEVQRQGDTVTIYRDRTHWRDRESTVHDTLYIENTDTLRHTTKHETVWREKERSRPPWIFWVLLSLILLACLLYIIGKRVTLWQKLKKFL